MPTPYFNQAALGGFSTGMGLAQAMRQQRLAEEKAARDAERQAYMDQFSRARNVDIDGQSFNVPESQAAAFAQQEAMRRLQMEQMRQEKAMKMAQGMEELAVPGYGLTGEVKPLKPEAEKLRRASGVKDSLMRDIATYQQMIKESGNFENPMTERGAAMDSLAKGISMKVKELDELGALTGPDWAILTSQVPQPFSIKSLFSPKAAAGAGLGTLGGRISQDFEQKMKSSGYRNLTPQQTKKKMTTPSGVEYEVEP